MKKETSTKIIIFWCILLIATFKFTMLISTLFSPIEMQLEVEDLSFETKVTIEECKFVVDSNGQISQNNDENAKKIWITSREIVISEDVIKNDWEIFLESNERISKKEEKYFVHYIEDGEPKKVEMDYSIWKTLKVGDVINIKSIYGEVYEVTQRKQRDSNDLIRG